MRLAALAVALLATAAPALAQPQTILYPGQSGADLLDAIDADYSPDRTLGYGPARDSLYTYEQRTDGQLCGVYTRFCITLAPGVDASTNAYEQGINAEHSWPQSLGAGSEPARSDLHHLFPSKDNVNSSRGNHPYGEIPDVETDTWFREGDRQSAIPTVFVDEWSERDNSHPDPGFSGRFEPREDHAGNAARAMFYFRAVYPAQVAAEDAQPFFDVQRADLLAWHYQDPVDLEEYARSAWIATLQGTENPFVLDSTLARRAYPAEGGNGGGGEGGGEDSAGPIWVNEIHYDNTSTDTEEGVEVAGPAGTDLAGWTLALYNGNGGTVYATVALAGTIPDQEDGYGTVWTLTGQLQNGSPDGIAVVDPDGEVVQFVSYEGALVAAGGPAAGQTATDIGVEETGDTPVGFSLQLAGTGAASADFTWAAPQPHTRGEPNLGQTFVDPRTPTAAEDGPDAVLEATVFPNPARDRATVSLRLPAAAAVRAEVFDALGRRVAAADASLGAGFQTVPLALADLPAGLYVVRVTAGDDVAVRRLTVVR